MKKTRLTLLALVLIFGLGSYLRLTGLTWGLPRYDRFAPLYGDEYNVFNFLHRMNPKQLDPLFFIDPTFIYYQLGAVLELASLAHLVTLHGSEKFYYKTNDPEGKAYYLQHPDQYGRLFVAGRILIVAYGLTGILIFYLLGATVSHSPYGGLLSALFYAVLPLPVISSHVIDVGVPVSVWLAAAFFCFLISLQKNNRRWLMLGAFTAGLSFSSKYTAFPIFLLMPYCFWRLQSSIKTIVACCGLSAAGFVLGTPFAILNWPLFWRDFSGIFFSFKGAHTAMVDWYWLYPSYHFIYAVGAGVSVVSLLGLFIRLYQREPAGILAALYFYAHGFIFVGLGCAGIGDKHREY